MGYWGGAAPWGGVAVCWACIESPGSPYGPPAEVSRSQFESFAMNVENFPGQIGWIANTGNQSRPPGWGGGQGAVGRSPQRKAPPPPVGCPKDLPRLPSSAALPPPLWLPRPRATPGSCCPARCSSPRCVGSTSRPSSAPPGWPCSTSSPRWVRGIAGGVAVPWDLVCCGWFFAQMH